MTQMITIQIPDAVAVNYSNEDDLQKGLHEDIVISEFQKGNLSIRDCAKILHLSYEGFLEFLGQRNLSFIIAPKEELDASYTRFGNRSDTLKKS